MTVEQCIMLWGVRKSLRFMDLVNSSFKLHLKYAAHGASALVDLYAEKSRSMWPKFHYKTETNAVSAKCQGPWTSYLLFSLKWSGHNMAYLTFLYPKVGFGYCTWFACVQICKIINLYCVDADCRNDFSK